MLLTNSVTEISPPNELIDDETSTKTGNFGFSRVKLFEVNFGLISKRNRANRVTNLNTPNNQLNRRLYFVLYPYINSANAKEATPAMMI